jgi:hypothetical protein
VRLLLAASSFDGRWMRGFFGVSLGRGVGFLFEDLVDGILVVGMGVLQVARWFWWVPTTVVVVVALLGG